MNKSSIYYSITFIFFISIVSIILALLFLMAYDKKEYTEKLNTKYSIIARATLFHLNNYITQSELEQQIQDYSLSEIKDQNIVDKIITNSDIIQKISNKIGSSAILKYNNYHYLLIENNDKLLLLKDEDYQPYRYDVIRIIFSFVIFIIIIAYIMTIRKIKPLRKLKREMDKFAMGDLNVTCKSDGADEISQVANSFHNAVQQIQKLNHSRQLFLRNIMHELKTPITKGRISVEMIKDSKQKERLIGVFEKLELLINEFASIEQITSGSGVQNVRAARLLDIVDEAIDLSMVPFENIKIEISENLIIKVDFKLFTTAIKNLIDNGIKYSLDHFVIISLSKNRLSFLSKGSPLERELEHYTQPFTQEKMTHQGFGLGLYIVENIAKAHHLKFAYKHSNGYNYFYFENMDVLL
ncbi:MAG: HAMP domain-containing histidine kinase [Sulfurospirillum sp.]|nr:HAMP domain-containing histidine kinase [Sulfurospirillum sp.]